MTRRGFSMLIVLLVLTLGALVATTALTAGSARVASSRGMVEGDQLRALAWSGAQAVMSELAAQRDELLAGGLPVVSAEFAVYETDRERGMVRLIDLDAEGEGVLASEAARVNLNHAPREALAALPGMSGALADAVLAARARAPLDSPERMLTLGVGAGEWFGRVGAAADATRPLDNLGGIEGAVPGQLEPGVGLRDLVTVFSVDPNVRAGVDDGEPGARRLPLNLGWTEELGAEIESSLNADWARLLRPQLELHGPIESVESLARVLTVGRDWQPWWGYFDSLCVTEAEFVPGLIDVNRARAAVLGAQGVLGAEGAASAVRAREGLDDASRASPLWVIDAERGVVEGRPEDVLPWACARSLQWRVRLEVWIERLDVAGEVVPAADWLGSASAGEGRGESGGAGGGAGGGVQSGEEPVDGRRMVMEAVVDVATPRARIAYLRDVTHLDLALALHEAARAGADEEVGMDAEASERLGRAPNEREGIEPGPGDRAEADRTEADGAGAPTGGAAARGAGGRGVVSDPRVGRWRGPAGGPVGGAAGGASEPAGEPGGVW